jgi:hypothetical protein
MPATLRPAEKAENAVKAENAENTGKVTASASCHGTC